SIQAAVASLQQLGELTKSAGIAFDTTAAGALEAASNITALAGGVDNLAAMQQNYVESYYSEAERQQLTLGNLTRQVTAFN
ncbi:hypothetical protein, partial [Salinicola sp. CPA57]|uniref:hypothetical protein n=1 Tax=Salinicola sp. CPA57 TaxID=1949080 RepID=UPI0018E4F8C3